MQTHTKEHVEIIKEFEGRYPGRHDKQDRESRSIKNPTEGQMQIIKAFAAGGIAIRKMTAPKFEGVVHPKSATQ